MLDLKFSNCMVVLLFHLIVTICETPSFFICLHDYMPERILMCTHCFCNVLRAWACGFWSQFSWSSRPPCISGRVFNYFADVYEYLKYAVIGGEFRLLTMFFSFFLRCSRDFCQYSLFFVAIWSLMLWITWFAWNYSETLSKGHYHGQSTAMLPSTCIFYNETYTVWIFQSTLVFWQSSTEGSLHKAGSSIFPPSDSWDLTEVSCD